VQERSLFRIYCTVTEIAVECWSAPDLAVTVTVKFCGGGPLVTLLLPPQRAVGRIVAASIKRHSAHILRRFLSKPFARTHPIYPSGSYAA
jgi:hypothetical protein